MARKKKRRTKKQQELFRMQLFSGISLFFAIIGVLELGALGRLFMHLMEFFVGGLAVPVFIIEIIFTGWVLVTGHGPLVLGRIMNTVIWAVPILAILMHAWDYLAIALSSDTSVLEVTWQRAIANFTAEGAGQSLGGGLLGGLLYTFTFYTVSQLGTYIFVGIALMILLCYLFSITWIDLVEGIQSITSVMFNWLGEFWDTTKQQFSSYREDREKYKADQSKQKASRSKAAKKGKQSGEDQDSLESNNRIKPKQVDTDDEDVVIVGPSASASRGNLPAEIEQTSLEIGTQADEFPKAEQAKTQASPATDDQDVDTEPDDGKDIVMDMAAEPENPEYKLPPATLLTPIKATDQSGEYSVIKENVRKLEATFKSFNVDAKVTKANLGPAVTKYEIQPAIGVKVSKIVGLADDIALSLAAKDIRIEAPIPGKSFIGIEVPNQDVSLVSFRDSFEHQLQSGKVLEVPLGKDISGNIRSADLTKMPHLLVAGSTGSGKSVAINGIIISILMKAKPNEVKLMMIDPKKVELSIYNGIPHLLTPVVTNPRKAAQALQKVVQEMERRYELFAASGQRNIDGYNDFVHEENLNEGTAHPTLPYIVVIVDELADLMMVASKEVEAAITRLAQMARAAGIHMILATQRPSVDVITGIIKANVPSRIAFAVSSGTDSRTIIDQNGAEKLLGRGDMLYLPMGESKPIRVQGAFITDDEVEHVVSFVKDQQEPNYVESMMPTETKESAPGEDLDEMWDTVLEFVKTRETVSISMLQRQFRVGYNRAARLVDDMEQRGIVGPQEGSKPRTVNIFQENGDETTE
ncbi:DNA translocase FtsK [Aerococcus viridans]|uniref:DNA translocase FtsK n=1 Tax=Aerococcus TaxID=1375 RepID=UPI0022E6436A|nr:MULTISPECIES: DNA translocase FtsK [Aerococcus]MEB7389164.1 DNA translocase FtsK [Aerococcus viridans]